MPLKVKKRAQNSDSIVFKEESIPPTAVIVAEDLANRFEPLSSSLPYCLLPLANVPILHFSLSRVICDGFKNIIIYACRHADTIRSFVKTNGYVEQIQNLTISVVNGSGSHCLGDVMRNLESNQTLRGVKDFVYIPADLVCDVNLREMLDRFSAFRKNGALNAVLGLALAHLPSFAPADSERLAVVYSMPDRKLIQLVRHDRDVPITCSGELFQPLSKTQSIEIRSRLLDPRILLCSSHIPPLFQDDFDYDSIDDLINGLLTNEDVMSYTMHLEFIPPDNVTLLSAPTLTHLLDVTPRLLTRLGNPITRPPEHLFTDAFSRLSGNPYLETRRYLPPVAAVSPTCYVSRSARIHPSARLIGACLIGENSIVDEGACLINTCLGDDCHVGAGSRLRNVVTMSGVSIGAKVVADMTWVCSAARILEGVRLGPRCFIGAPVIVSVEMQVGGPFSEAAGVGVCLGPDVHLPPDSIIVAPGPNDVLLSSDQGGVKSWAAFYQPSRGKLSLSPGGVDEDVMDSDSEQDSLNETDVVLWRTGWAPRTHSRSRNASRLYSNASDDMFVVGSEGRSRTKSGDFDEGDSDREGEVSDEFLVRELQKTLRRSLHRHQATDVIILEVNSLKHAYNISVDDLFFILIKALLEIASEQVKNHDLSGIELAKEFALSFKRLVTQFSEVLAKYLSSSESGGKFCLQAVEDHACYNPLVLEAGQWLVHILYDRDLVTEETIHWWVKESPLLSDEDLTEQTRALRVKIAPFLKWLEEAEEEDSDDE